MPESTKKKMSENMLALLWKHLPQSVIDKYNLKIYNTLSVFKHSTKCPSNKF